MPEQPQQTEAYKENCGLQLHSQRMASPKGKKRKTAECSPNSKEGGTNPQKQQKIDGFCRPMQSTVCRVSSPLSLSLSDSCEALAMFGDAPLEWELQTEVSQSRNQLGGLRTPSPCNRMINDLTTLSESAPCREKGLEAESFNHNGLASGLESQLNNSIRELISRHSMLTSQTVLAIFDQFAEVRLKLDSVINFIAEAQSKKPQVCSTGCQTERPGEIPSMVQSREGVSRQHIDCDGGRKKRDGELVGPEIPWYRSGGGNRRLLKEQIVLNIYNYEINAGRWTSKKRIVTSLSQLTRSDKGAIDLTAYEYLPQRENYFRILLKFKQQLFPSLLMRMKGFLAFYQILPTRVFTSGEVSPLLQRARRERMAVYGTADRESGLNRESRLAEAGKRPSVIEKMLVGVLDPDDMKLPSIGLVQDETFDSACLETFSSLPLMEQQEVLKKLKEMRKLLEQTIASAAPLASIVLSPSRHDVISEIQQPISPGSLMLTSIQNKEPETAELKVQGAVGQISEIEGTQEGIPQPPLVAKMILRNDINAVPHVKSFTVEAQINRAHGPASPKVSGKAMMLKHTSMGVGRLNGCVSVNEGGRMGEIIQEA